jgi:hypothetical protein
MTARPDPASRATKFARHPNRRAQAIHKKCPATVKVAGQGQVRVDMDQNVIPPAGSRVGARPTDAQLCPRYRYPSVIFIKLRSAHR